jgi:hypothetical protein
MRRVYLLFAVGLLGFYSLASWRGFELFAAKRGFLPRDVRQAPGGYRSYSFWRGGK